MIESMQKICKEELPQEFIKIMQTPLPTIDDITLYVYPESIEIISGKRWYSDEKYLQLTNSINDLLDKDK